MFEGAEHSENTTHKSSPPGSLESRRSFLGGLLGLGSFLVGALLSVPLIRFALFPLLRRTTDLKESSVGALTDFSSLTEPVMRTIQIEQVDGWRKAVSEKAVYVTRDNQGQLRHADLRMLARYAHVVPQDQREAVERTTDVFLRRSAANSNAKSLRIN
jgi:hypothetical protein